MRMRAAAPAAATVLMWAAVVRAQGDAQPALPPLPPPPAPAPPTQEPTPAPETPAPAPEPAPSSTVGAEGAHAAPGGSAAPAESAGGIPPFTLWVGGRLGFLAYGGGVYRNPAGGAVETTGNFVTPGAAIEVNVGARLLRRYIPYLALEIGLVGAGHRFEGVDTHAGTFFYGLGFRFVAGDVNRLGFTIDASAGFRSFDFSNGSSSWSALGVEILRLGLGVDLRVQRRIAISPSLTVSGGTLSDTRGNVTFGPGQGDGATGPAYTNGASIPSSNQTGYYAVVVGCAIHADLLGK